MWLFVGWNDTTAAVSSSPIPGECVYIGSGTDEKPVCSHAVDLLCKKYCWGRGESQYRDRAIQCGSAISGYPNFGI